MIIDHSTNSNDNDNQKLSCNEENQRIMTTAAFCHIEISAAGLGQADCGCALTGHVTPSRTPNDSNQFWVPKITERCFEPNIC